MLGLLLGKEKNGVWVRRKGRKGGRRWSCSEYCKGTFE